MLLLIVGPKLDLALETSKFTGFVKGDRVGTIQDVISCLESTGEEQMSCVHKDTPYCASASPFSPDLPHLSQVLSIPVHKEGSAVQGPGSPHSGLSRRIFSAAAVSHAPPLPVPSVSGHGPASSLGYRKSPQCQPTMAPLAVFCLDFYSFPVFSC